MGKVLSTKVMHTLFRVKVTPFSVVVGGQLWAAVRTTFGETLKPDPTAQYSSPAAEEYTE